MRLPVPSRVAPVRLTPLGLTPGPRWLPLGLALAGGLALGPFSAEGLARAADPPKKKAPRADWGTVKAPAPGPARSHGGYSSGCIEGAVALPHKGPGFQLIRPARRRHFGHPSLVAFVTELGARMAAEQRGLLPVGDLGQPRGGPAKGGHASHQTGLDADLWYALDGATSGGPQAVPLVDVPQGVLSAEGKKLLPRVKAVLTLAASDRRIERIFVNPVIKRGLCRATPAGEPRGWLHKVRPWWGHDEHFHVRLACPKDSPGCKPQEALPPGDGCAEIAWWLDPKAQAERQKKRQGYRSRIGSRPKLPERCQEILVGAAPPAPEKADGGSPAAPAPSP